MEARLAVRWSAQDVVPQNKEPRTFIHFLYQSRDSKMFTNHFLTILKEKSSRTINVIPAKTNAMSQNETSWRKLPTFLLSTCKGCASTMINSKMKRWIPGMNSPINLMSMIILCRKKRVSLNKIKSSLINWEELFFIMEQLILDIILVISRKVKIPGWSSMMKEWEN